MEEGYLPRDMLRYQGRIERIRTGATDPADRETVVAKLACSGPTTASQRDMERAGMADIVGLEHAFTDVPKDDPAAIKENDRLVIGDLDYRIGKVISWPAVEPNFLELMLSLRNR